MAAKRKIIGFQKAYQRWARVRRASATTSCLFNGKLEFNSHVHTMVTGGGLRGNAWVPRVFYDRDRLKESWRRAVIQLLREALRAGQLRTNMDVEEMERLITLQENRWWSVDIKSFAVLQVGP